LYCFIFSSVKFICPNTGKLFNFDSKSGRKQKKCKDSIAYLHALGLYEDAFARFPDSIDQFSYNASILAYKLNNKDKAFTYLSPLAKKETDWKTYPAWNYIIRDYAGRI
jgi:hypothetical protein